MGESENKLGQRLLKEGKITSGQLEVALKEQNRTREPLGKILNRLAFVAQADISSILAFQARVKFVDLRGLDIDPEVLKLIPYEVALKNKLIPLSLENGRLRVGMADPFDIVTRDEVEMISKLKVEVVAAAEDEISKILHELSEKNLGREESGGEKFNAPLEESMQKMGTPGIKEGVEGLAEIGATIKLVDEIIAQAIESEATDIHIEPDDGLVRIRYRVDGLLHPFSSLPKTLQSAVNTRIKILSNLNISETRVPQDGRIQFSLKDRKIDLRISVFPGVYGENIVIRLLDKEKMLLSLEQLGFSRHILSSYRQAVNRNNGIILVTGPTGSGKTTTLYATISQLNCQEKKIITLEDPVEYLFPLIRQSPINPKAGLTFASGLRAILRQDPDVILVGEIRDQDTLQMAMRAALTGHLVFSTLHTNDAAGAIPRLLDMGAEPYLLASSLIAVLSQRLIRSICPSCKELAPVDQASLAIVGRLTKGGTPLDLYRGKGCHKCLHTGYRGRIGIFELLTVSSKVKELILQRKDSKVIQEAAMEDGMVSLMDDALQKTLQGMTTLEEVLRVV